MQSIGRTVYDFVWNEWFWLPENQTWAEMRARPDVVYHGVVEVWVWPIVFGSIMLHLRCLYFNTYVAMPLAKLMGIPVSFVEPPVKNKVLEYLYKCYKKNVPENVLKESAATSGLSDEYITDWLAKRHESSTPTSFMRFSNTCFSQVAHIISFSLAIRAVYNRPWLTDISLCFENYPHQSVEPNVWYLYIVVLSFYWEQLFWQLVDLKNSQTVIEIIHHVTTIVLMSFSWTGGFSRMGTLFLVSHEGNDIPLLFGKMFNYAKYYKMKDLLFAIFVVYWLSTRMVIYPWYILWECYFRMPPGTVSPAVRFQYCWAFALLILNFLWTSLIVRVVYSLLVKGNPIDDIRETDESKTCKKVE